MPNNRVQNFKPGDGNFTPEKLIAPTMKTGSQEYGVYLALYKTYLEALSALKAEFWAGAEKRRSGTVEVRGSLKTSQWVKYLDAKNNVLAEGASNDVVEPTKVAEVTREVMVDGYRTTKTFSEVVSAWTSKTSKVVAVPVLVERTRPAPKQAAPATPSEQQLKEQQLRKKAARRRYRARRAEKLLAKAAKTSFDYAHVAQNNAATARAASKVDAGWTEVTPKGVKLSRKPAHKGPRVPKKERKAAPVVAKDKKPPTPLDQKDKDQRSAAAEQSGRAMRRQGTVFATDEQRQAVGAMLDTRMDV